MKDFEAEALKAAQRHEKFTNNLGTAQAFLLGVHFAKARHKRTEEALKLVNRYFKGIDTPSELVTLAQARQMREEAMAAIAEIEGKS